MIQRVQTLFLLGAVAVTACMLFLPFAQITREGGIVFTATSMGLRDPGGETVYATLPVFILILVIALLLFVAIFLFKNRKLQIRFCVYGIILEFGLIGLLYYFWIFVLRDVEIESYMVRVPVVFPVVAIILIYLAFRGIRKDEILIRSLDKIR
jgi:hypothetical protein